ncbi:DUF1488 family protein [Paraburkholderia nodosa]|uniref:DUF1488 domain-containing protein n=1 Tax=Paraburkholderia nodosa TaxID=392320 RepID=UPI001FE1AEC7|nr:DUF1488 domain-containing protein [Paraburkholderia nodosa]
MSTPASGDTTAIGSSMRRRIVALNFPNPNRVHDAYRHCVCFWGYDNAREIVFVVDDATLTNLNPGIGSDEPALLAAFDRSRDRILGLARRLYKGGRQTRCTISLE